MWNLKRATTQKITPSVAKEFAEMDAAPGDRCLSERRLQVYETLVREGNWRPCIWSRAKCLETGGTYRVNGKHTSILFSTLASEFKDFTVTIEDYECETLEDVARLYGTFDASITVRTSRDVNRAFASTIPELSVIPDRIINTCVTGINFHECGGSRTTALKRPPQVRAESMFDHAEFFVWVSSMFETGVKFRHLIRGGVAAAMYASWSKCKRDAQEFWTLVRDETGNSPNRPDRMIAKWLLTVSVNDGSGGHLPRSKKADIREMYVRCLHAWNAHRRNTELKTIKYYAEAKVPACL